MKHGWVVGLLAVVVGIVALGVMAIVVATSGDDTLVLDLEQGDCFDVPGEVVMQRGGRTGRHSEGFSYLLGELQVVARAHPGASW